MATTIEKDQTVEIELIKSHNKKLIVRVKQDGMIDLTHLAAALDLRLDHYFSSIKTKAYIKSLSSLPEFRGRKLVEIQRLGKTQHTFGHRLIVYNCIQYASPEFAAQFCGWIDNLNITGAVSLNKEIPVDELDNDWNIKRQEVERILEEKERLLLDKDKTIEIQAKSMIKLQTKVEKLKMRRHHPDLEEGYCFYCHHDGERMTSNRFKIGKTKDINGVLRQARRNAPYTTLDFVIHLPKESYSIVEDAMKMKFLEQRKPRSHEVVNASLNEITTGAIAICDIMKVKYRFADQSTIDSYNQFVIADTSAGEELIE